MSNWQMINEFTVNASQPSPGDPVVRINRMTKFDGTNVYSVQVGSVGLDFPARLGLFLQPEHLLNPTVIELCERASKHLMHLREEDEEAKAKLAEQAAKEKAERDAKAKAKRVRREGNLAARKAENQARASNSGKKSK